MVVFNTSSENYTIISPSFTNHHNLITLSTRVSKNIIILRWNQIKIPTKYFVFIRLSKSKDTILIKYLSGKQKFLDICQIRDMNRSVKLGQFGNIETLFCLQNREIPYLMCVFFCLEWVIWQLTSVFLLFLRPHYIQIVTDIMQSGFPK